MSTQLLPHRRLKAGFLALAVALVMLAARPAAASPFTDYSADTSLAGVHADVFRLYWAFFDREPDLEGAQYWVFSVQPVLIVDLHRVVVRGVGRVSATVRRADNAALIELVYNNVLHRGPDPDGATYWLALLSNGTLSRTTLVLQFSVSAEFRNSHPLPSDGRPYSGCVPPAPAGQCDPNYSDCVPIAFDVDCAGGTGDGPAYLVGTARVIGEDIYNLDGHPGKRDCVRRRSLEGPAGQARVAGPLIGPNPTNGR